LFVLIGGVLLLAGPRPGDVQAAVRHPAAWAGRVGPDTAAVTITGALCWLILVWLTVGLFLMAAAAAPGAAGRLAETVASRVLPASVRRIAAGLLGLSLTASAAGCAGSTSEAATLQSGPVVVADHVPAGPAGHRSAEVADWPLGAPAVSPGRVAPAASPAAPGIGVDWPLGEPATATPAGGSADTRPRAGSTPAGGRPRAGRPAAHPGRPAVGTPSAPSHRVVVGVGDCLWLIAARRLGAGATAAQVATEARRWYAVNESVIGADPDRLRPGQLLAAPSTRPS
jgi:hypothetical protein